MKKTVLILLLYLLNLSVNFAQRENTCLILYLLNENRGGIANAKITYINSVGDTILLKEIVSGRYEVKSRKYQGKGLINILPKGKLVIQADGFKNKTFFLRKPERKKSSSYTYNYTVYLSNTKNWLTIDQQEIPLTLDKFMIGIYVSDSTNLDTLGIKLKNLGFVIQNEELIRINGLDSMICAKDMVLPFQRFFYISPIESMDSSTIAESMTPISQLQGVQKLVLPIQVFLRYNRLEENHYYYLYRLEQVFMIDLLPVTDLEKQNIVNQMKKIGKVQKQGSRTYYLTLNYDQLPNAIKNCNALSALKGVELVNNEGFGQENTLD